MQISLVRDKSLFLTIFSLIKKEKATFDNKKIRKGGMKNG